MYMQYESPWQPSRQAVQLVGLPVTTRVVARSARYHTQLGLGLGGKGGLHCMVSP